MISRHFAATATAAVAVAATAVAFSAAPALASAGSTATTYTKGGGYVPSLDTLGRTNMKIVVPALPCAKGSADRAVRVGMFGSVRTGSHTRPWTIAVTVACKNGKRTTSATPGNIAVHPGDVVVLSQDSGTSWAINDKTTGQGVGGASGTTGPQPRAGKHMLFGARLSGAPGTPFGVKVRNAVAHGTPIGKLHPATHVQRRSSGKTVASAGAVRNGGRAFTVTVGKQSAAATPSKFTAGAGWVSGTHRLGNSKLKFVVPNLPCSAASPDRSVKVGMFGSTRVKSSKSAWSVYVQVVCHKGKRHVTSSIGGAHLGLRVGHVVLVSQNQRASAFGVEDLTSHRGVGVAGGIAGANPKLQPRALFGARFSGTPGRAFTVEVRNATGHGKQLGKLDPTRHTQRNGKGRVIATAGPITDSGRAFQLTIG